MAATKVGSAQIDDTLTSKTLTAPDLNAGTADSLTSLSIRDTSAAYDVTLIATSSTMLSAGRSLTIDVVNAPRSVKLGGNLDVGAGITVAAGKSLTINNILTLAASADSQTFTFPASSATVAGLSTTQTFTGLNTFSRSTNASGEWLRLRNTASDPDQGLWRLTATFNDLELEGNTAVAGDFSSKVSIMSWDYTNSHITAALRLITTGGLAIQSGTAGKYLNFVSSESLSADRNLTLTVNDAPRTVNLGGNLTIANAFITAGNFSLTLTTTNTTDVTLPLTGTLATLAGSETLSTKTLTAPKFASAGFIADANGNELVIFTTTTSAVNEVTVANGATGNNATITASGETNTGLTITGKGTKGVSIGNALIPKTSALSDTATPALDASLGNTFTLVATGDRTIAVPSNPGVRQKITIVHTASGGARTLSLNTGAGGFRFGSDITALTQTASGKTDYIGCIFHDTDSFFDVVAVVKGF